MTRVLCRFVFASAVLWLALGVFAQQAPTTAPAAVSPTTQPIAQIQKWFDNLASAESTAREQARTDLLGMSRADLETLREVVRRNVPLAPAQSAVLRDIVTHVYLAGDNGEGGLNGFLGVMLDPPENGVQENMQASDTGVYIFDCMPGYCGYRWLRPGDVVTGIFSEGEVVHTTRKEQLIAFVSHTPPGAPLRLRVLRQGQVTNVDLRIDARPRIAEEEPLKVDEWRNLRMKEADDYWTRAFVPIVGGMTRASSNSGPQA